MKTVSTRPPVPQQIADTGLPPTVLVVTMEYCRTLPDTGNRLLFLAECVNRWDRIAAARTADTPRQERAQYYADYLRFVIYRVMRYTLARQGVALW